MERPVIPEPPDIVDTVEALDTVWDPVHLQDVHILWDGRHCIDLQVWAEGEGKLDVKERRTRVADPSALPRERRPAEPFKGAAGAFQRAEGTKHSSADSPYPAPPCSSSECPEPSAKVRYQQPGVPQCPFKKEGKGVRRIPHRNEKGARA